MTHLVFNMKIKSDFLDIETAITEKWILWKWKSAFDQEAIQTQIGPKTINLTE